MSHWQPSLGASFRGAVTVFRVWAPDAEAVDLVLERPDQPSVHPMVNYADGYFSIRVPHVAPGDLYRFRVDGRGPFPDPASRWQPQGVHGPSAVVDPAAYSWRDEQWTGIPLKDLVLYELHTGTFTPAGTFRAAEEKLPELVDLGVNAVELMPVADFAGNRNWGYDGVAPFAPARCYGTPDDLRHFVDAAHGLGLAVFIDVVYNHFGPDGAYQGAFSRHYFSQTHKSPWGDGINFDGPLSSPVRDYFIENALRWVHEYHADGLRFDATHAIVDDSPRHILASITSSVRASLAGASRHVHLIAEDVNNLALMLKPESQGGWELDALWSDDFHHQMRRALAGDHDGYFQDFDGSAASIAETVRKGWFYCGQHAPYFGGPRGTDPAGIAYPRFVCFIQNHDQIGNRAFGDRLNHKIDLAAYRAASALLLFLPETPLLFMGQEWAASTPFLYFTDHHPELGKLVTEGRRREFSRFTAFSGPASREAIPDPQQAMTFEKSRLLWEERGQEPHASVMRLYRDLLRLRRTDPAFQTPGRSAELGVSALDEETLVLRRESASGEAILAVIRLRGSGAVDLASHPLAGSQRWRLDWNTEAAMYAADPLPPQLNQAANILEFARAGAALLRAEGKDQG
jgi:maltooligosyltrehalose trehalohydrolase